MLTIMRVVVFLHLTCVLYVSLVKILCDKNFIINVGLVLVFKAVSTPQFLPAFSLFYQCDGCLFLPFCAGAHCWVAKICQLEEWSPSQSRLAIVKAPGCLKHPTSTL